ncbi:hypothetical protein [Nocardioides conyzicola]|uniref:Uncharacterized protein n=1 Tax=Nocardioides conyzicola TaxID=1651781 RepID=A0ABP8WUK7_9ACTN
MRSEHRAPLIASIVVVLSCIGVMVYSARTDALGGLARHTPMGLIAGAVLQPLPAPAPAAAADAPLPAKRLPHHAAAHPAKAATPAPASKHRVVTRGVRRHHDHEAGHHHRHGVGRHHARHEARPEARRHGHHHGHAHEHAGRGHADHGRPARGHGHHRGHRGRH